MAAIGRITLGRACIRSNSASLPAKVAGSVITGAGPGQPDLGSRATAINRTHGTAIIEVNGNSGSIIVRPGCTKIRYWEILTAAVDI
ncbi:MAG TPA: hypothetical protein EYQ22_10370 [Gammaproteobacteria bacterium]|nr:hypothetical protein [Gammaproteobacteria bacterium]HIK71629.1 hypothetical protein [Pseudomonadales bacterium]